MIIYKLLRFTIKQTIKHTTAFAPARANSEPLEYGIDLGKVTDLQKGHQKIPKENKSLSILVETDTLALLF